MSQRIARLRINYLENPIGLDDPNPKLSWILDSPEPGAKQTHYRLTVGSSEGESDFWDSGKVETSETRWIRYTGKPLPARTRAHITIEAWDEDKAYTPATGFWESGPGSWEAKWIGGTLIGGPRTTIPSAKLRKAFSVDQQVASARIYITALGIYEGTLNGHRIGDWNLAPGWTDYRQRVRYQAFDISDSVQVGQNLIEVDLGDGWYCGSLEWRGRQLYGDRPRLLAEIHIVQADGSSSVIRTDETWEHAYGSTLEGDLLAGEAFDARLNYDNWLPVSTFDHPEGLKIVASEEPKITITEEIKPIEVKKQNAWPAPRWIFDLGQNMVGHVRLKVDAKEGQSLFMRFGEVLDTDGRLYITNLRSARQTDFYACKGKGPETWEPKFTFHGFRYVELNGHTEEPLPDAITGVVVHSDTERIGWFECSDPLINQLVKNVDWGWRGNSVDVPTDCPQRDERLGWTGDAQVFIRTATYIREVNGFFAKYVQDLADSQNEAGAIPPVAPNSTSIGEDGGPAWSDAFMICPWQLYRSYGDVEVLAKHYDKYIAFIDFLGSTAKDHIRLYDGFEGFKGFGDWLSINAETTHDFIGTAYYAYSVEIMAKIAEVLGQKADTSRYQALHNDIKQAFISKYVSSDGKVSTGSQTSQVLALHFGLLPEELRAKAVDILVKDIEERGWKLSTGFVGSSYLPYALSKNGRSDVAYKLLHQKDWPSWLYAVTKGATTIWERWDGWTEENGFQDPGMNSFNHYAYGAVAEWLFSTVAGIELDPIVPGFKKFKLAPVPGGELTWASAKFVSPYGEIASRWTLTEGGLNWSVIVPPNTTAVVSVPEGYASLDGKSEPFEVGPGQYELVAVR